MTEKLLLMKISFIGSGNVATHLAQALNKKHTINQIFSRSIKNAKQLANKVDAQAVDRFTGFDYNTDLIIVSVSDEAMPEIINKISNKTKATIAHTAGSIDLSILNKFENYGVFYPFQTFSKQKAIDFAQIPILIEGNNEKTISTLKSLATKLSNTVQIVSSKQRQQLHIAAVFACNFTNHMYTISEKILKNSNLDFSLLSPLIKETTNKLHTLSPKNAQTGPAVRNDISVINKHLKILQDNEEIQTVYNIITKSIIKSHKTE